MSDDQRGRQRWWWNQMWIYGQQISDKKRLITILDRCLKCAREKRKNANCRRGNYSSPGWDNKSPFSAYSDESLMTRRVRNVSGWEWVTTGNDMWMQIRWVCSRKNQRVQFRRRIVNNSHFHRFVCDKSLKLFFRVAVTITSTHFSLLIHHLSRVFCFLPKIRKRRRNNSKSVFPRHRNFVEECIINGNFFPGILNSGHTRSA